MAIYRLDQAAAIWGEVRTLSGPIGYNSPTFTRFSTSLLTIKLTSKSDSILAITPFRVMILSLNHY